MTNPTEETVLVTRFCHADMTAHKGFLWPTEGPVSCPDWDPTPHCGGGLHGWLWGKGHPEVWGYRDSDKMLVVEVRKEDIVILGGKVKFPKGNVVHCGDRKSVTQYMAERGHTGIIWGEATVGDGETAQCLGRYSKATAGANGTAIAGDYGKATAGNYGTAIVGGAGTALAGDGGTAMCTGDWGTLRIGKGKGTTACKRNPKPGVVYHVGKRGTIVQCRTKATS